MAPPAYICVECGSTADAPRKGSFHGSPFLLAIVGGLFILWGLNSPILYGATFIGFGALFFLLGIALESVVNHLMQQSCATCRSPRIVPIASPVGRRVVYTLESTQAHKPEAPPQAPG